jgi:hypothetical protein
MCLDGCRFRDKRTTMNAPVAFRQLIEEAINRCSMENGSNTPDFILADYLADCLEAYDKAIVRREDWYGRPLKEPTP